MWHFNLLGQNNQFNIHNGSFEKVIDNYTEVPGHEIIFRNWFNSLEYTSSDCFFIDSNVNIIPKGFPQSLPKPASGHGMIGFAPITWDGYFEIITGEFTFPMIKGKKYLIKFSIRHGTDSLNFCLRKLNAILSPVPDIYKNMPPNYDEAMISGEFYSDVSFDIEKVDDKVWFTVSKKYKARGGEKFITFGLHYEKRMIMSIIEYFRLNRKDSSYYERYIKKFFKENDKILFWKSGIENIKDSIFVVSYYFIDDVSVTKIK